MHSFKDRTVLVTGACGGLGRHLALGLARQGARVAAVDLDWKSLAALAAELDYEGMAWAVAHVTDRDALQAAVARLRDQLGPVDLLIANAGIGLETTAAAFKAEVIEALVRVNLIGVANSIEAVLPAMLERGTGWLA